MEGDKIEIHVADDAPPVEVEKQPTVKELISRLRRFRGRLPENFQFDRLEANERG